MVIQNGRVERDDVYDTAGYTGMSRQEIDDEVVAEARRILDAP